MVSQSAGAAYVYKIETNNDITLLGKITAPDGEDYDYFGGSVAIKDGIVVVGASNNNAQTGAVYTFIIEINESIRFLKKLTASDGKIKDYFGKSVTINDDFIVVGSKDAMYLFVELGDIQEYEKLTGHDNVMLVDTVASDGSKMVSLSRKMLYVYDAHPQDRLYLYGDTNTSISKKEGYIGSLYNIEAGSPNGALTYTLDVNDGSHFSIIDTNLTLEIALDFENPLDINSDNIYQTSITIEDSKGNESTIDIDVNITNQVVLAIAKEVASDKSYDSYGSYFGQSVAIDDNIIVVSAPYKNSIGAVYVFEKDQNNHIQEIAKLTPSEAIDWGNFGSSVDVSGDIIVVGADGHRNSSGVETGAVYVYQKLADGTIKKVQKIVLENGESWDGFGKDVSIDGDILVIGTSYIDAAYVFKKDTNGTMSQLKKLTSSDTGVNNGFGTSVAISGTSIVVGSSDDKGMGSVYLFEVDINDVTQLAKLTGSDSIPNDRFGSSIDISGSTIVVGSPRNQGKAYVFQKDLIGNVKEIGKITTTLENAYLGESVSTMNNLVIVGAPGSESTHLYQINADDTISKLEVLSSSDAEANDYFGASVDIYGNYMVVGAPYKSFEDLYYFGAIYMYNKVPGL